MYNGVQHYGQQGHLVRSPQLLPTPLLSKARTTLLRRWTRQTLRS